MHTAFDLTGPIVRSRLEPDFYKFTMGQLIWRKYPAVQTTFTFSNRTARARLGRVLDLGELREQFDHARSLMFTEPELTTSVASAIPSGACSPTGTSSSFAG